MDYELRSPSEESSAPAASGLEGLRHLVEHPEGAVRLRSDDLEGDVDEIVTFFRLLERLGGERRSVILVASRPTRASLRQLADSGLGGLDVVLGAADGDAGASTIEGAVGRVCPHLHRSRGSDLSVCGSHDDRMVLSARHMALWCLGDHACCPYRRDRDALETP